MGKTLRVKKIVSGEADLFAGPIIVPPFQNIDVFIGFGDGFDPDSFPGRGGKPCDFGNASTLIPSIAQDLEKNNILSFYQ
jgi:hypothetical protein